MADKPRRLRLSRRRLTALVAVAITTGAAGLMLMGPQGPAVAIPGPLRSFHAPLSESCTSCHVAAADAVQGILHGVVSTEMALAQGHKCLGCHGGIATHPFLEHGWPPDEIIARRGNAEAAEVGAPHILTHVPISVEGEIACATCHHEHQGRDVPLTRLSDSQCQTCHATRFESFERGHAEFERYPYRRRARIAFDHEAHLSRHFAEAPPDVAPSACTDCHVPDATGEQMLLRGYDASCATCHDQEIRGSAQVDGAGLTFLALPAFDIEPLHDAGLPIGRWPADAMMVETPLPPLMALLLEDASGFAAASRVMSEADPLDLLDAEHETLAAAADVIHHVKALLADIAVGGHDALRARITTALGATPTAQADIDALVAQLPGAVIRNALEAWLPYMDEEHAGTNGDSALLASADLDETGDVDGDPGREGWGAAGGWYRQDVDFTIRYRPGGHADPFLRAWIDATAASRTGATAAAFAALTAPNAIGACAKCHATESSDVGAREVAWHGAVPDHGPAGVTRFSHATHFPAVGGDGCRRCHTPDSSDGAYMDSYDNEDPFVFTPGFAPMSTADCAQCHRHGGASSACLTCHTYHARHGPRPVPNWPLVPPGVADVTAMARPPQENR